MLWSCGFPTERHSLFLYRSGRICPNMPEPLFPWNSLLVLYIGEAVALNMLRSCGFPTVRLPLFLCRSGRICPNMPEYALEFALNMLRFCGFPALREPLFPWKNHYVCSLVQPFLHGDARMLLPMQCCDGKLHQALCQVQPAPV